jgi:hypothetical protein
MACAERSGSLVQAKARIALAAPFAGRRDPSGNTTQRGVNDDPIARFQVTGGRPDLLHDTYILMP